MIERSCSTCRHEDTSPRDKPCLECLKKGHRPLWEDPHATAEEVMQLRSDLGKAIEGLAWLKEHAIRSDRALTWVIAKHISTIAVEKTSRDKPS